jgi:hypothetical protein
MKKEYSSPQSHSQKVKIESDRRVSKILGGHNTSSVTRHAKSNLLISNKGLFYLSPHSSDANPTLRCWGPCRTATRTRRLPVASWDATLGPRDLSRLSLSASAEFDWRVATSSWAQEDEILLIGRPPISLTK